MFRHLTVCALLLCAQRTAAADRVLADFGPRRDFFFGIATAPAHVEDGLHDTWLEFARRGHVAAFRTVPRAEERLRFWSEPEVELDLAASTGVKVFRMGVDWGRLVPHAPGSGECEEAACRAGVQDRAALARYQEIAQMARARGMRVMMTLFHHSLPRWAQDQGGWLSPHIVEYFRAVSIDVVRELADEVDYWITFNEPAVFAAFAYVARIWPPGGVQDPTGFLPDGSFHRAIASMTSVHNELYDVIHQLDRVQADQDAPGPALVGIAHNVAKHVPQEPTAAASALVTRQLFNFRFTDLTVDHLDFIGLNYYGAEYVETSSVAIRPDREYSDSGRAVNPYGMYELLKLFHDRYNVQYLHRSSQAETSQRQIPFIVTENGVSDAADLIRPAYLLEHLLALRAAMDEGVPVLGYVFWTLSDNWEWADGYCPKFGLVAVDREHDLQRTPRPSFELFRRLVARRQIRESDRDVAWRLVTDNVGNPRPFCRSQDGRTALDQPAERAIVDLDWRFDAEPLPGDTTLQETLTALTGRIEDLPAVGFLADPQRRQDLITSLQAFGSAFESARFAVEEDGVGRVLLGVHLRDNVKVVCDVAHGALPYHFVFDRDFYVKDIRVQGRGGVLELRGVRLFVGPTGQDDWLANLLMFRLGEQGLRFTLDGTRLTISAPGDAPLLDSPLMQPFLSNTVDLAAEGPQPRCRTVPGSRFRTSVFGDH
jgi:beta-glucosidase/6-phospho-beta-glucosidase/beta-galactosidase